LCLCHINTGAVPAAIRVRKMKNRKYGEKTSPGRGGTLLCPEQQNEKII
jgi:hypothetical protein